MPSISCIRSFVVAGLLSTALCAPAPVEKKRQESGGNVGGAVAAVPTATPFPPPGSSGSLRGSKDLGGYNPSNPLTQEDTVIPTSDFQLAPAQALNPEDGFFIDLSTVNNPQPIQGSSDAPTDPGPRTLKKKLGVV